MKYNKLVTALAAAGLIVGSGTLYADGDQPFHITGQVGSLYTDSDRNTRDDDVWWSLGVGYFFTDDFSLDLEYDRFSGTWRDYESAVPGATYDQWGLKNIGLMGRYYFTNWKARPFLAAGVGDLTHRNVSDEGSNLSLSIGAGLQGQFSKHLSGRLQLLYRRDRDGDSITGPNSFKDIILSAGLSFDFGGKEPPPPPPPVEKKAAPPPPPPNPDLDGDGVLNQHDKCPNTRPGAVVDLDGCEVEAVIDLEGVHFDFDKATLKPEAMVILNEAAALLQKHERVVIEVAGHTDSTGSETYNQGLSERRAQSVQEYLVSKGIRASRMTAKGYGEAMPVASNDTKAGRAENRRVELIVLDR
ncbi:MAG: OmpA family protein [Gammaproteobacteria bacterium]|nr:OmpA family protein [Gammaproteobacteria bacterium]MBT8051285.1 OmpA family protein [Gammaproteobacteria bacterium]MBT8055424.1 OmpA family protein [Gammaproteobacteria bacterium]NNJ79522.1 OmpA family protein [Xanthomonadales bacterium]NNK34356.1 OmpA family protein [Xanthomonadales bacterium]